MTALENRMLLAHEDCAEDRRDTLWDSASPSDCAAYVYSMGIANVVLGSVLLHPFPADVADELWPHLDEQWVHGLCKQWVEKHALDSFIDWLTGRDDT